MWSKLLQIYKQRSSTNKVAMMQEFHEYTMKPDCTVAQHVARVQNLAFRLRGIGKEVDDDTIMAKIITTLPAKYNAFKSVWTVILESAQTIPNLLDKLLQEEKSMLKVEEANQALASMTVSSASKDHRGGKCCNKYGNKSDRSKKNEKIKYMKCWECHEKGHLIVRKRKRRKVRKTMHQVVRRVNRQMARLKDRVQYVHSHFLPYLNRKIQHGMIHGS